MNIKKIQEKIQTKKGLYSEYYAERLFKQFMKEKKPQLIEFEFAKKMSIAKWTLPKMKEAVKNENSSDGHVAGGLCGLCFFGSCYLPPRMCFFCHQRRFSCKKYDWNNIEDVNNMLKAIKKMKW